MSRRAPAPRATSSRSRWRGAASPSSSPTFRTARISVRREPGPRLQELVFRTDRRAISEAKSVLVFRRWTAAEVQGARGRPSRLLPHNREAGLSRHCRHQQRSTSRRGLARERWSFLYQLRLSTSSARTIPAPQHGSGRRRAYSTRVGIDPASRAHCARQSACTGGRRGSCALDSAGPRNRGDRRIPKVRRKLRRDHSANTHAVGEKQSEMDKRSHLKRPEDKSVRSSPPMVARRQTSGPRGYRTCAWERTARREPR